MNFRGDSYYELNRFFLSSIGLWVYKNTWREWVQRIIFLILLLSGVIVQITPFLTTTFTLDIILKILPNIMFTILFCFKYSTFCSIIENVKELMNRVQADWQQLQNEEEIKIIKKYTNSGRLLSIIFAIYMYPGVCTLILSQFLPKLINVIMPLNETRQFEPLIFTEYFVDEERYFVYTALHMDVVVIIGSTTLIATETIVMALIQHVCGLFKIVR
ncbi:hypothetical protein KM043_002456 [Ampulex compressa]|nr:hypothetical protein KM043_002456 [Ampulex compressa]